MQDNQKTNNLLYVILNGSLNMSSGKAAAQAVHAAMKLKTKHRNYFMNDYRRTVIVLQAKNRDQMDGIVDYLADADIDCEYYIDEGANEVEAFSMTAIAVAPISEDDTEKRQIFAALPSYGKEDRDETDEQDEGDYYGEAAPYDLPYNMQALQRQVQDLRQIILRPDPVQPRWYKNLFKRKQKGFVS